MPQIDDPRPKIQELGLSHGFDAVGFAKPGTGSKAVADHLKKFLANGFHGDMGWMKETADRRSTPRRLWPQSKSIIVVGVNYGPQGDPLEILNHKSAAGISVYARGRDYHDVLKKKLRALASEIAVKWDCEVKLFVDTAPVLEKPLAQRAGIGWQGKHTNLVSPDFGSWLFLGEIFTTLEITNDPAHEDRCGTCSRCLKICPTNAFPQPYRLDARRCISYLTIEHKGHISREFRHLIGNRIYGCDDCLAVCPWNKFASTTVHPALRPHVYLQHPLLEDFALLTDHDFGQVFSGSPIKRLGRDRFVRNVLIAIGNSGNSALSEPAEYLLHDHSPLVRAMAVWALSRLVEKHKFVLLRNQYLVNETDNDVIAEWSENIEIGDHVVV